MMFVLTLNQKTFKSQLGTYRTYPLNIGVEMVAAQVPTSVYEGDRGSTECNF